MHVAYTVRHQGGHARQTRRVRSVTHSRSDAVNTWDGRHCSVPAAMQITVGSYVRIDEQCRTRAVRGLLCRVQALEC